MSTLSPFPIQSRVKRIGSNYTTIDTVTGIRLVPKTDTYENELNYLRWVDVAELERAPMLVALSTLAGGTFYRIPGLTATFMRVRQDPPTIVHPWLKQPITSVTTYGLLCIHEMTTMVFRCHHDGSPVDRTFPTV